MDETHVPKGWLTLHWAAWVGNLKWLERLLPSETVVDTATAEGNTCLFLAAYRGHKSIVQKLLTYKANPNATCVSGESALHQSSYAGHAEVTSLLIEAGADVDLKSNNGTTPLHLAASNGQLAIIKLLLDAGADARAIDEDGSTPGMIADENCYRGAAAVLGEQKSTFERHHDPNMSEYDICYDPIFTSTLFLEPGTITLSPHGYGCTGKSYALEAPTKSGRERFFSKVCHQSEILEVGHGTLSNSGHYWLVTEWIDTKQTSVALPAQMTFAEKLAKIHMAPRPPNVGVDGQAFGFHLTTYHGPVAQDVSWKRSWADFFAENKLRHVGRYIATKYTDTANQSLVDTVNQTAALVVPRLLGDGHLGGDVGIKPSLVHGDLWSGNKARGVIKSRGDRVEEYAFDAPCLYAHSEYELAPMHMFGGFPAAFFIEYHLLVPKTEPVEEYDSRMELYQLYHWLINYAVHGGDYYEKVMDCTQALLKVG